MKFDLADKVVVITGAARGIGLGTAEAAALRGAKVAVLDLRRDDVDRAVGRLGDKAFGLAVDVTDREELARAFTTIADRLGGIDVVVANAGIAPRGATVQGMAPEVFDRVVEVNLTGVYNTVLAALPFIVERRGHLLLTSSVYAFMNGVGVAPYAVAKAGVEQLGRALRVELAPYGATAGIVYYGFIDTDMVKVGFDEDPLANAIVDLIPPFLTKRLTPAQAGEDTVRGIERRAAQTITPARWAALSAFRGLITPVMDGIAIRHRKVHKMIRGFDARSAIPPRVEQTAEPAVPGACARVES
ncbi:short-chain dehydrogenase/reductase [Nocardia sp. GTS18]|uniref:short-chain dehydrogenase/reductase n=1 Tax=Nocardia sp. GTS18 TaxID=1778064 RepID=UPI0015EE9354|nr:short-chain dehydrogenase/reductase [Nocardia sp. GTS18]